MSESMIPVDSDVSKPAVRWIHIRFPNGDVWRVDAEPIAKNRAEYYAKRESEGIVNGPDQNSYQRIFWDEFHYAIRSDDELRDWMFNNMDWKDLPTKEFVSTEGGPNYHGDNWTSADVIMMEKDAPVEL